MGPMGTRKARHSSTEEPKKELNAPLGSRDFLELRTRGASVRSSSPNSLSRVPECDGT